MANIWGSCLENLNYIFEDVSSKWIELAESANTNDEIFVFSPFITGEILPSVFDVNPSREFFIITCLDANSYLGGSLDLDLLCKLIKRGAKVFHLPRLHAKFMFVGKQLTLGSQNFTIGGKSNVEASIHLSIDKDQVVKIEQLITSKLSTAHLLDEAQIDDFRSDCERIREEFDEVQKQVAEIDLNTAKIIDAEKQSRHADLEEIEVTKATVEDVYVPIPVKVVEKTWENDYGHGHYFTLASTKYDEILNIFLKKDLPVPSRYLRNNMFHLEEQKKDTYFVKLIVYDFFG